MLRQYEGCIGVKTGYTQKSGRCLVSAAERDGVTVIAVTINSPDDWKDHTKLLNYGFANYRRVELCPADFRLCLPVVGGKESYTVLGVAESASVTVPVNSPVIEQSVECPHHLYASVNAGDICGRMLFLCDTNGDGVKEIIKDIPLVAQFTVEKNTMRQNVWQRFWQWLKGLFA
jgi:D-alanyl-D-alanine carboxypeptidase/D-alanyl-D-alanine carboxypeptidase (penicillin-binding protein 5/6)